jgi:hypothetical protein
VLCSVNYQLPLPLVPTTHSLFIASFQLNHLKGLPISKDVLTSASPASIAR